MKRVLIILISLCALTLQARELADSGMINFRQAIHDLDLDLGKNRETMDRFIQRLNEHGADSVGRLTSVIIEGAASPEGGYNYNKALSQRRANTLLRYLRSRTTPEQLPDSVMEFRFLGRDWAAVARLAAADPDIPYKQETLALLRQLAKEAAAGDISRGDHTERMKALRGGEPWRYMYRHYFPVVRASRVYVRYIYEWKKPELPRYQAAVSLDVAPTAVPPLMLALAEPWPKPCKPFYMGIRTNMLFDALLVPNIGAQFYLGKNISIGADWGYAWWKSDRTHHYWRVYGGDIVGRWWFGRAAHDKPLTGHHLGVYGQVFTYDIELGGKGQMGGKPGGTLWDRCHWGAGIEYGYTLPIARRLNIDFSIGFGYAGGIYYEYEPQGDCYVWQATKQRRWFGPTKADISLVWLIGCGNYNRKFLKKGGGL